MYPIAFAAVEVENKETWAWLMQIFFDDIEIENGKGWVFITDKQNGLRQAINALMRNAEHRHCVRHLHNNFKSLGHSGLALKQRLWAAARATTIPNFDVEMDKMLSQSHEAYKWLKNRPTSNWSRSHFSCDAKCDILLNNLCECFNAAILEARDKPIVSLLERIRIYLMLRMAILRELKGLPMIGLTKATFLQCLVQIIGEKLDTDPSSPLFITNNQEGQGLADKRKLMRYQGGQPN